jgi:hypothetical protein
VPQGVARAVLLARASCMTPRGENMESAESSTDPPAAQPDTAPSTRPMTLDLDLPEQPDGADVGGPAREIPAVIAKALVVTTVCAVLLGVMRAPDEEPAPDLAAAAPAAPAEIVSVPIVVIPLASAINLGARPSASRRESSPAHGDSDAAWPWEP